MNVSIRASDFAVTDAIASHTRERMRQALRAFDHNVVDADVFLRDVNAGKGGADKRVVVHVRLRARQSVAVEATGEDLYTTMTQAARRTRRAVKRTVNKQQRIDRMSLRDLQAATDADSGSSVSAVGF
ncbi:MAG: HPF/RaiA family ribosome-associated protein [Pseudomonadota bacterium]